MTEPIVLDGLDAVRASAGTALGPTGWVEITAERLEAWDEACPGAPVGYLLVSLTNLFMPEMVTVTGVSAGLNVGTGEIGFADDLVLDPGTAVRATGEVVSVEEAKGGVQTVVRITVETAELPLVTVDAISRWLE